MCCFSRPIEHVSATRIFARRVDEDRQALVYSMNVEVAEELAMVLPLPVAEGAGEDAVRFVDLSGYAAFFADLQKAFPEQVLWSRSKGPMQSAARRPTTLAVHDVGDFVASFVPTPADFERLDARFRIAPELFRARPAYADHGFAVFQLKPRRGFFLKRLKRQTVHPMAFTFPSRRPRAIFFPTLHVHDGSIPERAAFDHALYLQTDDAMLAETITYVRSKGPLGDAMKTSRTEGLVDPLAKGYRNAVTGTFRNADTWVEAPRCRGLDVLAGRGELFRFRLATTAAYYTETDEPRARAWFHVASERLDALHDGLAAGLARLTAEHRDDWDLRPVHDDLPSAGVNAQGATLAPKSFDVFPPVAEVLPHGAPCEVAVTFHVFTEIAEPQNVVLAFRHVPTYERVKAIEAEIAKVVARALT